VAVIGVGNRLRRDDGAGIAVARRLATCTGDEETVKVSEQEGETLALLETWQGAAAVLLVDAVRSGAAPGTVHRADASRMPVPAGLLSSTSTHAVGLGETIELARALGRLPPRVLVFGVEGSRFDAGEGLTREVEAVLDQLAELVMREARLLAGGP
jgi:hydrogenase maturation protease